jgi:hypothetical protein
VKLPANSVHHFQKKRIHESIHTSLLDAPEAYVAGHIH